jgi:hypothetical protein
MMQLIEFTVDQATIIAFALPIVAICLFIIIFPSLKKGSSSKLRRYLSYLVTPPRIGSLESQDDNVEQKSAVLWREIKVRLYFVYLAIALFLVSFMISEFYQVMSDLSLPVTQGSTGEIRTVTSVVFMNPFEAGWIGAMPWYGQLPAPASFGTYHTSWSWIFITATYTDNPDFLNSVVMVMLLISIIEGLVFLVPLASKTIRRSFLPSMFFFLTSMMVFTKTAVGCAAQAIALALGAQIQYGISIATGDMVPNLNQGIAMGLPVILAMFLLFVLLGWKLWKVHYQDSVSRRWFMFYVTMSFWLGLAIPIVMS